MMIKFGNYSPSCSRIFRLSTWPGICAIVLVAGAAHAQEPRYSWFEIGLLGQNQALTGSQVPVPGQAVTVATDDGTGVRFRGSLDIWNNFNLFGEYGSVDPDVSAIITNEQGQFTSSDEFDLTTIRGGLGYRFPVTYAIHIIAEVSYDSLDYDFGSFAGEDFDSGDSGVGALVGIRTVFWDDLELRANARYTSVGTVALDTQTVSDDTLFAVGMSYMFLRGLSVSLDYETGEIDTWSIGFRLDLEED
jgi:hypothetical protein